MSETIDLETRLTEFEAYLKGLDRAAIPSGRTCLTCACLHSGLKVTRERSLLSPI